MPRVSMRSTGPQAARGHRTLHWCGATAFGHDAADAEIHLLEGGHFLLESAGEQVAALIDDFLGRRLSPTDA